MDSSPLLQSFKFGNFIWIQLILAKNLSNFVPLPWKLHNRKCHIPHSTVFELDQELDLILLRGFDFIHCMDCLKYTLLPWVFLLLYHGGIWAATWTHSNFFIISKQQPWFMIYIKGVHPTVFVLNIFPNLHLIQKCIYNQQLFWNIMNQMRIWKNIRHKDDRMKSL